MPLDAGGDVGLRHPGHVRVAGERGHLQSLAGRRVGLARRAVAAGAVLLENRRAVGGERDAGDGEEEGSHEWTRVAHRRLLSRQLLEGPECPVEWKAPARQRWST